MKSKGSQKPSSHALERKHVEKCVKRVDITHIALEALAVSRVTYTALRCVTELCIRLLKLERRV